MTTTRHEPGRVSYGLGNLGANIFSQAFATFILFFYVDHLHAPLGPITVAMSVQSVWHAVLNPAMGLLSDRTRSRWGRRLPWVAAGFLPLGLVFWLLWHPLVRGPGLVWYFFIVVALFDFLYLLVVINWTSLFPERFRTLASRSQAAQWRQIFGIAALMMGVSLPPVLYGRYGWSAMGALLALVGTSGFAAVVFGSRRMRPLSDTYAPDKVEPLWAPFWAAMREPGFWRYLVMNFLVQFVLVLVPATIPFFAKYVLHLAHGQLSVMLAGAFVVALVSVPPWSQVIQRLGSHRAILTAIGIMGLGVVPFFVVDTFIGGISATIVLGMGLGGFLMLVDIVMAEFIDAHHRRAGVRREGAFYGVNGFILRLGTTLEALIIYVVFHVTGYHSNVAGVATPEVRYGMRILVAAVPAASFAVALVVFRRSPLAKQEFSRN